jgi:hypothetical protein
MAQFWRSFCLNRAQNRVILAAVCIHEKDLMPTPRLLQVWPIPPPLGHILSRCCPSRQGKPSQTVKRISLVYTCDTKKEQLGKQGVTEAIRIFFLSIKKHQFNPMGPLVLEHFKEHVKGLYTYPMRDNLSGNAVARKNHQ